MKRNIIETVSIFKTKDYGMFKKHLRNRDIVLDKKLLDSINTYGQLMPIIISTDGYIADGQHRLEACKALGLPYMYMFTDLDIETYMIEVNSSARAWKTEDYIKHSRHYDIIYPFMIDNNIKGNTMLKLCDTTLPKVKKKEAPKRSDIKEIEEVYDTVLEISNLTGITALSNLTDHVNSWLRKGNNLWYIKKRIQKSKSLPRIKASKASNAGEVRDAFNILMRA